jgi:RNA polymerase sporulation-specific sigma factor
MLERISLRQAIDRLPERENMVIKLRYFHGLTQERVSKVLQVSQVQVSRIEKKALSNLRELLR